MSEKCNQCKKKGVLLFPVRKEGTPISWICIDCMKLKTPQYTFNHFAEVESSKDVYVLRWKLEDELGNVWIEEHQEMTLSDFEVLYGANIHKIQWMTFREKNLAVL